MADDVRSRDDWPPGRVLVLTATYDERENIGPLIAAVRVAVPEAHLLVIDDESPDGTGRLALEQAAVDPFVHVLVRRGRRGLGGAIREGLRLARARGFEVAVNMDADFSHDPADVPRLLAALEPVGGRPADVVVGSRRLPGGRTIGWPLSRRVISRLVGLFARWVLRVPVSDASSGFRAVRLAILEHVPALAPGPHAPPCPTGYAFFEWMLWAVHRAGGRIVEVPITFTDRTRGRSKADFAEALRSMGELIGLARRTWLGG